MIRPRYGSLSNSNLFFFFQTLISNFIINYNVALLYSCLLVVCYLTGMLGNSSPLFPMSPCLLAPPRFLLAPSFSCCCALFSCFHDHERFSLYFLLLKSRPVFPLCIIPTSLLMSPGPRAISLHRHLLVTFLSSTGL